MQLKGLTMDSTISTEIKKLSIAERILLVEELWNSILSDQDKLELTSSQRDELDSRLEELRNSLLSLWGARTLF